MLMGMGFGEEAVTMALRATNNDPDEACSWLMDSAGDADGEISGLDGHDDSSDSLSRSMQDELEQGWPSGPVEDTPIVTPAAPTGSATPSMSTHTPAPPGIEPGSSAHRGTSPVRRGHTHVVGSGFTVPSSAVSGLDTTAGAGAMDHDESSFAIQRPATSPRGSTMPRRPMQPGSSRVPARTGHGAGTAEVMHHAGATSNCGITPNNLFERTASQFTTGGGGVGAAGGGAAYTADGGAAAGVVMSAAFSAGGISSTAGTGANTPRGDVTGTLFSPPDQQMGSVGRVSGDSGSATRVHFAGLDTTLDLNSSSASMSMSTGGDTPSVLNGVQALSNRARAAEEMAVALQAEVEQQMMRNEMLGRQLQDERAANASVSKQLRQVRLSMVHTVA